jgi:glycerol-3-phosphate dehydrogenase
MCRSISNDGKFDVIVIGGGINGCAVFWQLALSGLRCLLIEKADFSSGTSGASSRMAHGGLRYLETGNLALVRESLAERNRLFRNASHLVRPADVVIPYRNWVHGLFAAPFNLASGKRLKHRRGGLLVHAGLWLYDRFSLRSGLARPHRRLNRTALDEAIPGLAPDLRGAGCYADGLVLHPERLALELVLDGMAASPASAALNHCTFQVSDGQIVLDTGGGQKLTVSSRAIVNASGPYIDQVNGLLGRKTGYVVGSQGLHLIIDAPLLASALKDRIVYFETPDGRLCLAYVLDGKVFTGTTDQLTTRPDGEPDFDRDAAYILANLNHLFPKAKVSASQIAASSFGVRALAANGSTTVGALPRDHLVATDQTTLGPVTTMVGGKWTTFRSFADDVAQSLTRSMTGFRPAVTQDMPIGGGRNWPTARPARLAHLVSLGLDRASASTLVERYGSDDRIDTFLKMPNGCDPICNTPLLLVAEVVMYCRQEMVLTLSDAVIRRWQPGFGWKPDMQTVSRIADHCGRELGWDEAERNRQIADFVRVCAQRRSGPGQRSS